VAGVIDAVGSGVVGWERGQRVGVGWNGGLAQDPAAELLRLGGASVILATATNGDAMSAVQGGLAVRGSLIIVGAVDSMQVSPLSLIMGSRSVKGWYSGTSIDSQDTLAFSARTGVRSMNETSRWIVSRRLTAV
jgi:D-arabinose 1-dehydrogenase-like Zn-dependent alcohol dehydrogenase